MYDAGAERLSEALSEILNDRAVPPKAFEPWVAWVPSTGTEPLASSRLIAEPPSGADRAVLAPWTVTALPLTTGQAIDLLCACVGQTTLATGRVVGKTLAFWATVLRFAGALVAREQFLPGMSQVEGTYQARWEPVLSGADATRAAQLARSMPHACRALTPDVDGSTTRPAASEVLGGVLGTLVDGLVRSGMPEPPKPRGRRKTARSFESVHDHWLHALRAGDPRLDGDEAELATLAEHIQRWRRPIAATTATPYRLCFRLEEPEVEDNGSIQRKTGDWHVRYLLQAADDPSLLVPVADAWNDRGRSSTVLRRGGFKPQAYLLASLGQASTLCPRIEESLKDAASRRLHARRDRRARVPQRESLDAGAGRLRRAPAGLVDPQGDQAPPGRPRGRQVAEDDQQGRPVARRDPPVQAGRSPWATRN